MYSPGPLAVAVTPDGKTALASISGGWLGLVTSGIPAGDGTLVFVDLEARKVKGELFTGASPMGIAIAPDGKHAFVGQLSDTYIAYVDIEKQSYQPISTGNQWNEELAIDDSGTIGALTTGTAGDSMSFSVMNPMSHGQTLGLTGDAGGVAFFPGTKFAFVVQAPTMLTGNTGGYNVLDLSDPASPNATDNQRVVGDTRQAYPVTAVKRRNSVVYPVSDSGKLSLIEMKLDAGKATMVQTVSAGDAQFSYGLTATPDGKILACAGGEHFVAVVDLDTGKSFTVPWGTTEMGPMDIEMIP
jgi:DNA-binding beta-propeller fold protein YncE